MPERDAGAQTPLVLLVEDERALRKVMELVLQGEGYDAMTANNGREALALLEQARPNLIISDYVMPEMDGGELVRRVRADDRLAGIPILLMSSGFPEDLPERDLVDLCMEKGGKLDVLLDAVASLIAKG
ncbi:chemosensory pili system protein ChpA (sensor histidine kinase/response regulator) [Halopseudomonas xinjiangensis]|uniref:Chemosensory pili system protein ChpA (Sensor histidine kinase/response regulator) n=1 Tax=Halopseudomonas xinjiangensis TaxID=487184 RepID=A0A1H1YMR3_9GAMM|nr:response regulator [Halopseudomonas xinjiangensis]SDT22652.1 chemosensory pili system protein ChpA (sensor histidine kinase/response regulator) [Halopseudomonas xinjiangensis]